MAVKLYVKLCDHISQDTVHVIILNMGFFTEINATNRENTIVKENNINDIILRIPMKN